MLGISTPGKHVSQRQRLSISMKDVARRAGVSVGTVSNVLNNKPSVDPALRLKVMVAVEELGFVRNESARHLRTGASRAIALVIFDAANPFFAEMSRAAESVVRRAGSFLLMADTHEDLEREGDYLRLFEEQRMQGVLIAPMGDVSSALRRLRKHGIPSVLVDARPPDSSFSAVRVDDVKGGQLAAAHLLQSGRQRIGFLGGPAHLAQIADRLEGVKHASSAHVRESQLHVWHATSSNINEGERIAQLVADLPISSRPNGIVATNDLLAMGLIYGLMRCRVQVPDDIAVVGYDDIPAATSAIVPVSSIRQPTAEMGAMAAQMLLNEIETGAASGDERVLEPQLVIRASSVVI